MTPDDHKTIERAFAGRMGEVVLSALRDLPLDLLIRMRNEAHERTEDASTDFESNAIGFAGALLTQAIAEKQISLQIN